MSEFRVSVCYLSDQLDRLQDTPNMLRSGLSAMIKAKKKADEADGESDNSIGICYTINPGVFPHAVKHARKIDEEILSSFKRHDNRRLLRFVIRLAPAS